MTAYEMRISDCSSDVCSSDLLEAAARVNTLRTGIADQSSMAPVQLDRGLVDLLHDEAHKLGLEALAMASGAGHDAQTMQALCPSALIFVPSHGGIRHSTREWTAWADGENGGELKMEAPGRPSGRSEEGRVGK